MNKMDEFKFAEKAMDEKSTLEQLKEATEDVWNDAKKMIFKAIKENIDVEDDESMKLFKKLKKLMNSAETLNDLSFAYMAEQDKKIDMLYGELTEINSNNLVMIEEQRNTNKILKDILKQEGNNCTVLGKLVEKK